MVVKQIKQKTGKLKKVGLAMLTAAGFGAVASAIAYKVTDRTMRKTFDNMELTSERIEVPEYKK